MESESRDRVASLPAGAASPAAAGNANVNVGVPQALRPRAPSLIPNLDEAQVEIIKQGWINKQGGAKGGRKNWSEPMTTRVAAASSLRLGSDWRRHAALHACGGCARTARSGERGRTVDGLVWPDGCSESHH